MYWTLMVCRFVRSTRVQVATAVICTGTTVPFSSKKWIFLSQSWTILGMEMVGPFWRAWCGVCRPCVLCLNQQIFAVMSIAFICSVGKTASGQNFGGKTPRSESWEPIRRHCWSNRSNNGYISKLWCSGCWVSFSSGVKNKWVCEMCVYWTSIQLRSHKAQWICPFMTDSTDISTHVMQL